MKPGRRLTISAMRRESLASRSRSAPSFHVIPKTQRTMTVPPRVSSVRACSARSLSSTPATPKTQAPSGLTSELPCSSEQMSLGSRPAVQREPRGGTHWRTETKLPANVQFLGVSKAVRGHWPLEGSNPSPLRLGLECPDHIRYVSLGNAAARLGDLADNTCGGHLDVRALREPLIRWSSMEARAVI